MAHRGVRRAAFVAGVTALPLIAAAVPAALASASPATRAVRGNSPAWVRTAKLAGHANTRSRLTIHVGLAPRDAAGAAAYASAVSSPHSAQYAHYLTPAQYLDRFGPTADQAAKVRSFLAGAGLTAIRTSASRSMITASGTVAQVQKAFHVDLNLYRHGSKTLRAPNTAAQVPAELAGSILSIGGLTSTTGSIHPAKIKALQVPTPCSSYYGEHHVSGLPEAYGHTSFPTANCGYTPSQVRGAYGLNPDGLASASDGKGVTVAIIDAYASKTMRQDVNTYSTNHGLPTMSKKQYTQHLPAGGYYDQKTCGAAGWGEEESLDVEAVHSMAPGANIAYVPSSSCNDVDFLDAYDRVLAPSGNASAPLATIVSNSYGDTSDLIPGDLQNQEHAYFVQGATEGVGFYFSSGDDGDSAALNGGIPQPTASANDPAVTAVGGTSLGVNADNSYQFETGYGDTRTYLVKNTKTQQISWLSVPGTFYDGAGGGTSSVWAEPAYQKGVVPDSLAALPGDKGAGRVVPDIAADGSPYTGFLIGLSEPTYAESSIGGTSLSCPLVAGAMAVAQQRGGGTPIGFANPLLYSLPQSDFNDVSTPATPDQSAVVYLSPAGFTRLVGLGQDSSLKETPGYDNVTGLGSPTAALITAVANR